MPCIPPDPTADDGCSFFPHVDVYATRDTLGNSAILPRTSSVSSTSCLVLRQCAQKETKPIVAFFEAKISLLVKKDVQAIKE